MVYTLKPRRKARKARRNPAKARKHKKAVRKVKVGWHRPRVFKAKSGKWYRPKRRSMLKRGTRINPRRTRRNPSRLPKLPFDLQTVALGGVKIAGGIALGVFAMKPVAKLMLNIDKEAKYVKYYGLVHVLLGAVAASMLKKQPLVRDMALTVAGVGVYDLISKNVPQLGLPDMMQGEEPGVIGYEPGVVGADDEPALMGASYMGASYMGRDDIAYGEDNDSLDC